MKQFEGKVSGIEVEGGSQERYMYVKEEIKEFLVSASVLPYLTPGCSEDHGQGPVRGE